MTSLIQFVNDWDGSELFFEDTKKGMKDAIAHLVKVAGEIRIRDIRRDDANPYLFLHRVAPGKEADLLKNDQDWFTDNDLNPEYSGSEDEEEKDEGEEEENDEENDEEKVENKGKRARTGAKENFLAFDIPTTTTKDGATQAATPKK